MHDQSSAGSQRLERIHYQIRKYLAEVFRSSIHHAIAFVPLLDLNMLGRNFVLVKLEKCVQDAGYRYWIGIRNLAVTGQSLIDDIAHPLQLALD